MSSIADDQLMTCGGLVPAEPQWKSEIFFQILCRFSGFFLAINAK